MLLFINFDEEVGRVKTKLFSRRKKNKIIHIFIYLFINFAIQQQSKFKKIKEKKGKENEKKKKKMARTPQHSCQLQQAQNIKENKTRRERKKAINLYATSNLTLPD